MSVPQEKETKAQRIERLKREKNAWDHIDEIREFARKDSIRFHPSGWARIFALGACTPRATG